MEARKIIEIAWKKGTEERVEFKISRCRREIIRWSKEQRERSLREVLQKQTELEVELSAAVLDNNRIKELSEALSRAYKEEELFWRQRSRILWLIGGDRTAPSFTR